MPRLLVVNPNTTASMTRRIGAVARAAARAGTEIDARNPAYGPAAIEGPDDQARCLAPMLDVIVRGEREGCEATVIACFDDPGVAAARALVAGPVVGIAEAAMHAASQVARRWGIVTTVEAAVPTIEKLTRLYGVERQCVGVVAAGVPVLALEQPSEATRERVLGAARTLVVERGSQAIVLGCAGMSTLHEAIAAAAGVPVVDGVVAAVGFVERMLEQRRSA